jgi:hypothetical protein
MLIKIEDIPTVPLHSSSIQEGKPLQHRDISWFCVDAQVYSFAMMSMEDVDDKTREEADHAILELKPLIVDAAEGGRELEYNEVCILTVHAPVQLTVLFNTRAYLCNEKGDTVEKIVPKCRPKLQHGEVLVKVKKMKASWKSEMAQAIADNNEPPCLRCAKRSTRLMQEGVVIGTQCEDCGEQVFEDWEQPRVPKVKPLGEDLRRSTANRKGAEGNNRADPPNNVCDNH